MTSATAMVQADRDKGYVSNAQRSEQGNEVTAAQRARELVWPQLDQVEQTLVNLPDIEPPELRNAVMIIVRSGGKRLRPLMVLLTAAMFGHLDRRTVDLASAVEMLHTATLVHDDLIDGSLMRRGTSTLNATWTPAATVLTGDYLFATAAGLAARTDDPRVIRTFADTLGVIVAGELSQQFTDWTRRSTREDYYARIYAKTASMFILVAKAAGMIGGAREEQLSALVEYGLNFGLAFQIVDDVLDFVAEPEEVGKPVGNDLRSGLITLPAICYREANPSDNDINCALQGTCDQVTYDRLVERIRESDAIASSLNEASTHIERAKLALETFPNNEYRTALYNLTDYALERSR